MVRFQRVSPSSPGFDRQPAPDAPEHQVVHQLDAYQRRCIGHPPREQQIRVARRRIAARVGMEDHDAGGAAQQACLEDLARLDLGATEGTAEDLLVAEEAVADVEEQRSHDLLVALLVAQQQEPCDVVGAVERPPSRDLLPGQAAGELAGRQERRGLGVAQTAETSAA